MTERPEPPPQPDERTALDTFLDYFRATLRWKAGGLTDQHEPGIDIEMPAQPMQPGCGAGFGRPCQVQRIGLRPRVEHIVGGKRLQCLVGDRH